MARLSLLIAFAVVTAGCAADGGADPLASPRDRPADKATATSIPGLRGPQSPGDHPPVPSPTTMVALRERESGATTVPVPDPAPIPVPPEEVMIEVSSEPAPGTVALTFDDGPFEDWTATILDVLDDRGVTATFFVSTYLLPKHAHLIPLLVDAGHSVQSHGNRHIDMTRLTEEEIRSELLTSIYRLVAAGAPRPACFRPPYGARDETVERVASDLGLEVVMWSVDSADTVRRNAAGVIDAVVGNAADGDIVLLHDQWAPVHETALPAVIEDIVARGLGFSPLCMNEGLDPSDSATSRVVL